MAKNVFQDMVRVKREKQGFSPPKIESEIKRKPIAHKTMSEVDKVIEKKIEEEFIYPKKRVSFEEEIIEGKNRSRNVLWLVAIITVVFLFFAISTLFVNAKVTISPKVLDITLDENFSGVKESSADNLSFDLVVISGEENIDVKGAGTEDVRNSAKGSVVIYNAFSNVAQTLAIDTRLEGSNGKIYKTEKKMVVPGMKSDGTPGSVEVGIYGAEPGDTYNSAPLDFKILGFKGTPKYSKIYARSKGDIAGGLIGTLPTVSPEDKTIAQEKLKDTLKSKLFLKATNQIPKDFILFKDAITLSIDNQSEEYNKDDNTLHLSLSATLYGFLFKEVDLTQEITKNKVSDYDGSEVFIPNIKDLNFTLTDTGVSFKDVQNINFKLGGNSKIVWRVDENKLTADLLEKSKKAFQTILLKYPNISEANLVIRPFWKRSFPDKLKDINITVNYPK